jgi:hypothetical protein
MPMGPFIGPFDIIGPLGPMGPPGPMLIGPPGPMFLPSMPGLANLCRNSKLGGPLGPACELGGLDGRYWIVFGAEAFTVAKVPPGEELPLLLGPMGPPGPIMELPGPPGPIIPGPPGPPGPIMPGPPGPGPIIGPLGPIIGPLGPIMGPFGRMPRPPGAGPIIGPLGPMLSMVVGEESRPGMRPPPEHTGLPSGPSMAPPSGEFIIPGSRLPMEPRPESGPWPTELGVEQGVVPGFPVSCCDICAMLLIGSKGALGCWGPGPGAWVLGVPGLSGMLMSWGAIPRPGDSPGKRPLGEGGGGPGGGWGGGGGGGGGWGGGGGGGEGTGKERPLSWLEGVPGQSPRYIPPSGPDGVRGPGYLGGACSPGVLGPGDPDRAGGSPGCGVLGSPAWPSLERERVSDWQDRGGKAGFLIALLAGSPAGERPSINCLHSCPAFPRGIWPPRAGGPRGGGQFQLMSHW